jgi:2-polyprenyl-3-methyl-5-hydroxy-6-metoxy-1,4-benzoquinol methylase
MQMPALDPTAMYRLSAVRDVEYEPTLTTAQGYDYLLQITEKHPAVVLEDCLYTYRIHAGSRTRSDIAGRLRFVQMVQLRAAVRRRVSLPPIMRLLREPSPNSNSERDNNLPAHFIESVLDQRRLGRRFAAFRTGLVCAGVHPFDPSYYKALAYSIVPVALLNCLRSESGLSELTRTPEPVGEKPPLMAQVGAYDSWERDDILALVPVEAKRVLSCGCGSGLTEETLVRRGANVLGIEVDPAAAGVARLRGLRILAQNLEGDSASLPDESFDCMIYADVLEHLRDPETVLRAQRAHLMPGGAIVVSVPNFRNFSVLWQLFVRGHVHHTDSGILDRTHMKLTTRRLVESWLGMLDMNVDDVRYKMNRRRDRVLSLLTLGVFDEWLATQILVVARDTRANDMGRLEPAPPIRESHASARVDLPA